MFEVYEHKYLEGNLVLRLFTIFEIFNINVKKINICKYIAGQNKTSEKVINVVDVIVWISNKI